MALQGCVNFITNIRTHAFIVGILLTLEAAVILLMSALFYIKLIIELGTILLISGIVSVLCATMFWVGFLKRLRWCLTLCIRILAVIIVLLIIGMIVSISEKHKTIYLELIAIGVKACMLSVTHELRKNLDLTLQQNEISAQANIPSATLQP